MKKGIYIDDTPSDFSEAMAMDDKEYEEYLKKLKEAVEKQSNQ